MKRFGTGLLALCAATLTLITAAAPAADVKPLLVDDHGVVKVGPGSYLTTVPKPCKNLPENIFKTDNLKGPVLTGQWWSSMVWRQFSENMFAHPLMMKCTATGLDVGYPGTGITANAHGIFAPKDIDLHIGHSSAANFTRADCDGYSDWFVTAAFVDGDKALRASFGHGSPFIFCQYAGGDPTVTFKQGPRIFSGEGTNVLGVTINNHSYGLFGATGTTWSTNGNTLTNAAKGKPYFSVALLPDDKADTLALFKKYAYNHVTDTKVEFAIDNGNVKCDYVFTTKAYEGTTKGTIFALYPHQWKYATSKLSDKTYMCINGTMKVGEGEDFTTVTPIQGVLPLLPEEGVQNKPRMIGYLKDESAKKPGGYADTYWEGKYLGRLATLSGVAESTGDAADQKLYIKELERRLEEWFTAAPGKEKAVFYYNSNWGTLVGSPPSYGSDSSLNDHHFHYGYFIRAAGEIARVDPAWAKKWAPMVNLLMRDIASTDRNDKMFAYLRCFDKYAGHSWASGDAGFADGNNQESSSESMNAWYGMIMWGQATGDLAARDAGLFLYNVERTAVEEYWFDVSGTNYPKTYPNVALGIIWGGKGDFATWFSGDIDCIHGINWLPFTPASIYMGRHPDYVKKNYDSIVSRRKGGTDFGTGWGDLVVMFGALNDPAVAAKYIDDNPKCKLEDGNSHAFMYHWIYTLNNLGVNDASVTADYPIFNVYKKDGKKTYVAYNYTDKPMTITFSDGVKMDLKPKAETVRKP